MEVFSHIKTIVSIILSLGIGTLLNGTMKFIQHPGRTKPYWIHLLWVLYVFLMMIHFWWWEYRLNAVVTWTFTEYIFVIAYIMLYFVLCQLLYPTDVNDYDKSYEKYFISRKRWFYLLLALIFVVDLFDTLLKGKSYYHMLMPLYGIRLGIQIALCLFFAFTKSKSRTLYGAGVIFFILFELYYIVSRNYLAT